MDEITKDTLEAELQRDLEELEGKGSKKSFDDIPKKTVSKKKVVSRVKKVVPIKKDVITSKKAVKKSSHRRKKTVITPEITVTPLDTSPEPLTSIPDSTPFAQSPPLKEDNVTSWVPTIVIILILIAAIFVGARFFYPTTGVTPEAMMTYNGVDFIKDKTHWRFQWVNEGLTYTIPLRFNPEETKNVSITGVLDPKFNKLSPIYIAIDPETVEDDPRFAQLGSGELSFNIVQALKMPIIPSCAVDDGSASCIDRPIVSCQEGGEGKAVIQLRTAEPAGIFLEDTCIILQGEGMELLRSIDRLLYQWYGIIEP